jgi:cytochrome P450
VNYLEQLDAVPADERVPLVLRWLRTDWRPFLAELRAHRPILRTARFTLVTRYTDVTEVLARENVFSVRLYAPKMDPIVEGPYMLARDDTAVNWREKGIMQAVLRPEDLYQVRRKVAAFADRSLDRAVPTGRIEVVSRLGRFVPVLLCGAYFGFPGPDLETMYRWSQATHADMFKNLLNDPGLHEDSVQAGKEMRCYLAALLDEKRRAIERGNALPAQDVFSRLIRARFPAELGFDDQRILANVAGLLIGAGEMTSQGVAQALEQLLRRPEVASGAIAAAHERSTERFDRYVWEALRFNPVTAILLRYCESDYTVAAGTPRATRIAAGTTVFACTASAMFDADVVPEPERFRSDRPDHTALHFGYGHHACLGRHVAGVMLPEIVRRVLRRRGVGLLPPPEGTIDFAGGPFPERFVLGFRSGA